MGSTFAIYLYSRIFQMSVSWVFLISLMSLANSEWNCSENALAGGTAYFKWSYIPNRIRTYTSWEFSTDGLTYRVILMYRINDDPIIKNIDSVFEACENETCDGTDDTAGMILHNVTTGYYRVSIQYASPTPTVIFVQYIETISETSSNFASEADIVGRCGDIRVQGFTDYPLSLKVDLRNARIPLTDITINDKSDKVTCPGSLFCQKELQSDRGDVQIMFLSDSSTVKYKIGELCRDQLKCIVPAVLVPIILAGVIIGLTVALCMKK